MTNPHERLGRRDVLRLLGGAMAVSATGCSIGGRRTSHRASPTTGLSGSPPPIDGRLPEASAAGPGPWTARNLGMNLAWLNDHHGGQQPNWLSSGFDAELVAGDLEVLAALGIRSVRAFCPIESVMAYDGGRFTLDADRAGHLHTFLDLASALDISIIPVMADGHVDRSTPSQSLDGLFRWELITSSSGVDAYRRAVRDYVQEFGRHGNVMLWELHNEPYGNLTWSSWPTQLGITRTLTHDYLVSAYQEAKEVSGAVPVGFSDLEEEQQDKYRLFSVLDRRAAFVDDCSDVYALHIYRAHVSQLADFTDLTGKPKWCLELGSYNYADPTGAAHHGLPAHNELLHEAANYHAFRRLSRALRGMGFSLFMPWSMASNPGMFIHEPDGRHIVKDLPRWMAAEILASA